MLKTKRSTWDCPCEEFSGVLLPLFVVDLYVAGRTVFSPGGYRGLESPPLSSFSLRFSSATSRSGLGTGPVVSGGPILGWSFSPTPCVFVHSPSLTRGDSGRCGGFSLSLPPDSLFCGSTRDGSPVLRTVVPPTSTQWCCGWVSVFTNPPSFLGVPTSRRTGRSDGLRGLRRCDPRSQDET